MADETKKLGEFAASLHYAMLNIRRCGQRRNPLCGRDDSEFQSYACALVVIGRSHSGPTG
jgi:hypothetical protein